WKMSLDGHVLWKRMVVGPCCPFAIIGKPSAAAPVVTPPTALRKRRRVPVDACLDNLLPVLLALRVMRAPPKFGAPRRRWAIFVACCEPGYREQTKRVQSSACAVVHYRH